jgi:hypothetical protein
MARYPDIKVCVTDAAPSQEIVERAVTAMRKAGISSARRSEFRAGVPRGYAMAVEYVREWCETD